MKSQILAGGRGLGTFKSGLKGGVHIVKTEQVEDIAGTEMFHLDMAMLLTIYRLVVLDRRFKMFWLTC